MEKIAEVLQQLATKLGTTVELLWAVLIKQATIEGYIALFWCGIGILLLISTYFVHRICAKERKELSYGDSYYENSDYFLAIVPVLMGIAGFVMASVFIGQAFSYLNNPEYWALKEILKAF